MVQPRQGLHGLAPHARAGILEQPLDQGVVRAAADAAEHGGQGEAHRLGRAVQPLAQEIHRLVANAALRAARQLDQGARQRPQLVLAVDVVLLRGHGLEPTQQRRQRVRSTTSAQGQRRRGAQRRVRIVQRREQTGLTDRTVGGRQHAAREPARLGLELAPGGVEGRLGDLAQALQGGQRDLGQGLVGPRPRDGSHGLRPPEHAQELDQHEPGRQVCARQTLVRVAEGLAGDRLADALRQLLGPVAVEAPHQPQQRGHGGLATRAGRGQNALQQGLHRPGVGLGGAAEHRVGGGPQQPVLHCGRQVRGRHGHLQARQGLEGGERHQPVVPAAGRHLQQRGRHGLVSHHAQGVGGGGLHVRVGIPEHDQQAIGRSRRPDPRQRVDGQLPHVAVSAVGGADQRVHHRVAAPHQRLHGGVASPRVLPVGEGVHQHVRHGPRLGRLRQPFHGRLAHAPAGIAQTVHQPRQRLGGRERREALHGQPPDLLVGAVQIGQDAVSIPLVHVLPQTIPRCFATRRSSSRRKSRCETTCGSTRLWKRARPSAMSGSMAWATLPAAMAAANFSSL